MEKEAAEMVIEIPQIEEMKAIAEGYDLDLKTDELNSILDQFGKFKDSWQMLADGPDVLPPVAFPRQSAGYRPNREEDPLNAVLCRCAIKGATAGKLAG